jgi:alkylation response protein AidB-like acyl-CoA dehydrogenase
MSFIESEERRELRKVVGELGKKYGYKWFNQQARTGGHTTELWLEAGKLGFLGVNLPEQYGDTTIISSTAAEAAEWPTSRSSSRSSVRPAVRC